MKNRTRDQRQHSLATNEERNESSSSVVIVAVTQNSPREKNYFLFFIGENSLHNNADVFCSYIYRLKNIIAEIGFRYRLFFIILIISYLAPLDDMVSHQMLKNWLSSNSLQGG